VYALSPFILAEFQVEHADSEDTIDERLCSLLPLHFRARLRAASQDQAERSAGPSLTQIFDLSFESDEAKESIGGDLSDSRRLRIGRVRS
jgi:hypothetical protein